MSMILKVTIRLRLDYDTGEIADHRIALEI